MDGCNASGIARPVGAQREEVGELARMAMMGRHSVAYHATNIGLAGSSVELGSGLSDESGRAFAYYGSAGETPLVWGGSGAAALGLGGEVSRGGYEAVFAEGGAFDPTTGSRLVATTRPGMELVVSAQKSLAELGVIGRGADMHAILEAETEATLAYLDGVVRDHGGRRGRRAVPTATEGLVYVRTRHATSRELDPSPHDHVLVANVVAMGDEAGGFKALNTAVVRDHLHAATMVGRMASAAKATELGYGIEADPGPSGRLGHWRIAGFPDEVLEAHSKRDAAIRAEMESSGFDSPRAHDVAVQRSRPAKTRPALDELTIRWQAELEGIGHPVAALAASVAEASRRLEPSPPDLSQLIAGVLGPEGELGRRKVFSRPDAIVALAPALYGQAPAILDTAVEGLLADRGVVPFIGVAGTTERAYTTTAALAVEEAIASATEGLMARADGPVLSVPCVAEAIAATQSETGHRLTRGQKELVHAATGSGRRAELAIGVAGSGKTTALRAVTRAFSAEGYTVIGTATSGQAARTLGSEADISESRTLASLAWRLGHDKLSLTERHVVVLDEVGMTDDPALLGLLKAVQRSGAKLVMVGDWRQLGPVGPGGAFEALLRRHRSQVVTLADNVRQFDADERQVLLALRSGSVAEAVDWYADAGRLQTAPTRTAAMEAAVGAWAADVEAGRDSLLLAWRRDSVEGLNVRARSWMEEAGRLDGPELAAAGGRRYRRGDLVVRLAPSTDGALVTSERGVVISVDGELRSLSLRMQDGRTVNLAGGELARDRLDHGYATTVHRAQGATAARAHLLADGGGRELAYVGMSRARETAHVYVVADTLAQAKEGLAGEWSRLRRPRWVIDTGIARRMDKSIEPPVREPASPALHLGPDLPQRETAARRRDRRLHRARNRGIELPGPQMGRAP